jgi:feruloyl esterase
MKTGRGAMMRYAGAGAALLLGALLAPGGTLSAAGCEPLAAAMLPDGRITSAGLVAAGAFTPPGQGGRGGGAGAFGTLPAFCRVVASLTPTPHSDITIEVWMPASGWNGKFMGVGNGGWTGSINYSAMADALRRGYATASTDTGHVGGSAAFALEHPEKLVDFGSRSIHLMTMAARQLVASHYDRPPQWSYFNGCSAGGRQGLKMAQLFPEAYNGIIAGAPAADWTGRAAQSLRVAQALRATPDSNIPREKYQLIHDAALAACDAADGVRDGVIENPAACRFDPAVLRCAGADDGTCLTAAQVEAARQIYAPAENPRTGRTTAGLVPGTELGWATWGGAQPLSISVEHFRYVVHQDPDWDPARFDFDRDIVLADERDGGTINALDPDLRGFFGRGGRLLQYHGWADPQISAGNSVDYYASVVREFGGVDAVHDHYRLFMVPGMAHCGGGTGPNSFDMLAALEAWVEQGQAPDRIVASRLREGEVERTRPLCPYPQVAVYAGTGSTDQAEHFVCRAP